MNWLGRIIQKEVQESDLVLDLGCGIMQATTDILNSARFPNKRYFKDLFGYNLESSLKGNLKCKSILGCDIWPDYLKKNGHFYAQIPRLEFYKDITYARTRDEIITLFSNFEYQELPYRCDQNYALVEAIKI